MVVDPGGAYFGFYSDFGDVSRGEVVTYSTAVASAAAAGARPVADVLIPADLGAPAVLSGHPHILQFDGTGGYIELRTTYDNGYWGDGGDASTYKASNFLVELLGPDASSFIVGDTGALSASHYVSSDGGQYIYVRSESGTLLSSLTRMKVWRAVVFPGDPIPEPATAFWTGFIGAREIV